MSYSKVIGSISRQMARLAWGRSSCESASVTEGQDAYQKKKAEELARFKLDVDVHELPQIFHYWSHKYVRPMLEECGVSGIDEFFAKYLFESAQRTSKPPKFLSVGSGNCDLEVRVAKLLRGMGLKEFEFHCLELNPAMLERGLQDAGAQGLAECFSFIEEDFNSWQAKACYSGIMANHSLHHVVHLEHLFDSIKSALHEGGSFVVNDMIGRNGHQRWPEALALVQEYWAKLPERYHYHHLMKRSEPRFINHDCSSEGFEGIRAQDILPLLIERFHFHLFIGFANVVSPFIDRGFGHNFDETSAHDREFIDRLHLVDEAGFKSGKLKPTQMLAVMFTRPVDQRIFPRGLTPEFSVRRPD